MTLKMIKENVIASLSCKYAKLVFLILLAGFITGCSEENQGSRRFVLSGEITYQGQPIPVGFISFAPDTSQGNQGPGGGAPIKEGHYETLRSKGLMGGHYKITITGTDGVSITMDGEKFPEGKMLFRSYQTGHDFPKEDSEWNFEVPVK